MTYILQEKFSGVAPKIKRKKLSPEMATTAQNCSLESGAVQGIRANLRTGVSLNTGVKTIYPHNGAWLQWGEYVSVAANPVANDYADRIYYTDSYYPKYKHGGGDYRLGIPRAEPVAATAPEIPSSDDEAAINLEVEDIYYVVTLVNIHGTEGPPSLASTVVRRVRDAEVTITFGAIPTGNYQLYGPGAKLRLYRSNTGTDTTVYQFVTDVALPLVNPTFVDAVPNASLQEVLPSATWIGPPDDDTGIYPDGPLQGLCTGPNGMMAGYSKSTIYLSEPYLPHAWPNEYKTTIDGEIKAILWIASGLLVVTDKKGYILTGSHPASMSVFIPEKSWPCFAPQSMVDMGGWAIYVSRDGLVGVDGSTFTLLTEDLIDGISWDYHLDASAVGGNSEGRYVLFQRGAFYYTFGAASYIFDPRGGMNALVTLPNSFSEVAYTDHENRLCVADDLNGSRKLAYFDNHSSTRLNYTWESKDYIVAGETNFAYLEVHAEAWPVTITVYGELMGTSERTAGTGVSGGSEHVYTITKNITALPAFTGEAYNLYRIKIGGTNAVTAVILHEDLTELG